MHSDVTEAEINETISKCGMNQEIIQKSCGDGKIEKSTLYLLMGIFRSGTENFGSKNQCIISRPKHDRYPQKWDNVGFIFSLLVD